MKDSDLSKYFAELGRKGGNARAKSTTPEQRRRIALKGARASARARKLRSEKNGG